MFIKNEGSIESLEFRPNYTILYVVPPTEGEILSSAAINPYFIKPQILKVSSNYP